MKEYFTKMKGVSKAPPAPGILEIALAFIGSGLAMALIGFLHNMCVDITGMPLLMAPLGASAVLVFGAFRSPLAQPRNVVGGHVVSALVGVTAFQLIGDSPPLAACLAVAGAIALMHITKTLHPPGGATAFLTAVGGTSIHAMGYWYVLTPCAIGAMIMIFVGLIVNNIPRNHRYPQFWW